MYLVKISNIRNLTYVLLAGGWEMTLRQSPENIIEELGSDDLFTFYLVNSYINYKGHEIS